jgi:Domain of unknown function (DUF4965)
MYGQRDINTVDVIYPSMPIFLYTNPVILSSLLEPVLRYMESGQYGQLYVPHDLGNLPYPFSPTKSLLWNKLGLYPIASGTDPNAQNQPVEGSLFSLLHKGFELSVFTESANMIIMALAAARISGSGNQLNDHVGYST